MARVYGGALLHQGWKQALLRQPGKTLAATAGMPLPRGVLPVGVSCR